MTRILRRAFTKHVRALAIAVVVSLLFSSLPVSSSKTQNAYLRTTAPAQQSPSVAAQLYSTVSKTVTSIGSWMASFIEAKPSAAGSTYQPVAAYLTPAPPFVDAPTNLAVTAASSSSINLSWTAPSGTIDHYVVERSQNIQGPFFFLANVTGATTKNDTTVTNLNAYLYRVRAVSNTGAVSAPSNMALGTAISFQFSSLAGQQIRAQHFHDVRTAINAVRPVGNLAAATWTRATLTSLEVKADDVNEMRSALDSALSALSIPVTAYTDSTLNVGANGTLIKAIHIEQLQTRSTRGSSTSSGPIDSDSSTARLDPLNETGGGGENPLSRNFNWTLPLLSLPGRAGLDLGLTLSYNSLVWTKIGANAISFDDDNGFPGPGFRLGFPVIQPRYFNSEVGKQAYLLISTDGSRIELRQVESSNFYEAADSSHLLLDENTMILRSTDGTQMSYVAQGGEFQCTQIKDRNGNFITVSYNAAGRINTVTDTLNRVITFNYTNGWLMSITQSWKQHLTPSVTHYWARFDYTHTTPIDFNFGSMAVFGLSDNSQITTLSKVTLADDSRFEFNYTSWGQVWKVTRFAADNSVLNYRSYDLPQTGTLAHSDCPRFTVRKDWAKYWNGDTNGTTAANEEVTTATFIVPVSDSWTMPDNTAASGVRAQVTTPDGTLNKIYFVGTAGGDSGWKRGLPALVETESGAQWKRKVMTIWTQDDETSPFVLNPRVKEANVYDPEGNRARTEIDYGDSFPLGNGMSCHLPRVVIEYAANASTKLRSTRTTYNMATPYTDRRILGLVSVKELFEGDVSGALKSKVSFFYDNENGSTSIQGTDAPVQHDNTAYTASFVSGRGNLSSVQRHNVVNGQSTTSRVRYNTAGAVVSSKDALDHETTTSYADSFSDGTPRNTLAYPTKVTDPDTFESTTKYDFDFGAVTSQRTPKPNETTNVPESQRPEQVFTYDSVGRLEEITNSVNSANTRLEYSTSQSRVDTYQTIQAGLGEAHSFQIADGLGRVVASAKDHTPTTFSGQKMIYDLMGRMIKTSNPTETTASGHPSDWNTAGDDAAAGWIYTEQTYDWKGRPLVTTNQDGTTKSASYAGCGCAGGEVVTLIDEGTIDAGVAKRRQQKIYSDVLGRTVKTEVLNWEGSSTVLSATVNTYNVRDQVTLVRVYAGPEGGGSFQDTTMGYDGFGRLETKHLPQQQVDPTNPNSTDHTTWTYNADDTVNTITDARGALTTFGYADTNRGLVKTIDRSMSGQPNSTTSFSYDSVGNRLSMNDPSGTMSYAYNALSQMTSETRTFAGRPGSFTITYGGYNLGGSVLSISDPFGGQATYQYDSTGRLLSMGASGYNVIYFDHGLNQSISNPLGQFVSEYKYRASGAPKQITFGNGVYETFLYNAKLELTRYDINNMNQFVPPNPSVTMSWTYDYYNDGRLNHANDLSDPKFDRKHDYGPDGKMTETYTNRGARGLSYSSSDPDPYRQTIQHDVWGNMTSRTGRLYQLEQGDTATFSNNRRVGTQYDAEGNPGVDFHTFDAANKQVHYKSSQHVGGCCGFPAVPDFEIMQTYDGLGQPASNRQITRTEQWVEGENGPDLQGIDTQDGTIYFVRSTLLGGAVIAQLSLAPNGQLVKNRINIYGNGRLVAKEVHGFILFEHHNPVTGTSLDVEGHSNDRRAMEIRNLDPFGSYVPNADPLTEFDYLGMVPTRPFQESGNPMDLAAGCSLDQIPIDCSFLNRLTMAGGVQSTYPGRFVRSPYSKPHVRFSLVPLTRDVIYHGMGVFEIWLPGDYREERRKGESVLVFIQNPLQRPMDTSGTERILTKDCIKFLNKILAELQKIRDVYSSDFSEIFQKAKDSGRLYNRTLPPDKRARNHGGVTAPVGNPNFELWLETSTFNRPDLVAEYNLIHDLFHAAPASGQTFNHDVMAQAALNAIQDNPEMMRQLRNTSHAGPVRRVINTPEEYNEGDDWYNGTMFTQIVRIGCPKPPQTPPG